VLSRVARLSDTGRQTVEAAAVIGPTVEPGLLARVAGEGMAAAEAVGGGLLEATEGRYAFRHEIARQAVLEAIDPARLASLHRRVLAEVTAKGAQLWPAARLAHHAVAAGDADSALRFGRQAADEATHAGAHREAVAQLARLEPYSRLLPATERGAYFEHLAREQFLTARPDLGLGAFDRAAAAWREAGDPLQEIRTLTEAAKSYVGSGRIKDAYVVTSRATAVAEQFEEPLLRAEALNVLAYVEFQDRDSAVIDHARSAIGLAIGDARAATTTLMAWNTIGAARIYAGDRGGIADLQRSLEMATDRGLDLSVAHAYANLVESLAATFRFADADPNFEAGLRYVIDRELDAQRSYMEAWLAIVDMYRGRWPPSADRARRVAADPSTPTISRIVALVALGRVLARRGDPEARRVLAEALTLAAPTESAQFLGPVRAARAELSWLQGNDDGARAEADTALRTPLAERHAWVHGELLWWRDRALAGDPPIRATTRPWQLQLEGRWREAATAWRGLECEFEAARSLLSSEDPGDVEEARASFDRLGSRPAVGLASRRLRQLGVRSIARGVRPSTRANPAGLTARELEVLSLIAAGLSNDQMAARLFVSPRTVHHHVSAVLAKLGVNRRTKAVDAAARLGVEFVDGGAQRK
jgi:DNA-binding CsgD family transcriptional regulator/tetratricopeptide (TPR) repeat protein